MEEIDRDNFVPESEKTSAQKDIPLQIPEGQTISAPHMVMMMLAKEAGDIQPSDTVLEIGTGSGYNAVIISGLLESGKIVTIERHQQLVDFAKMNIQKISLKHPYVNKIQILRGDGTNDIPNLKFNKILVTACGPRIPKVFIDRLSINGKLIIPVGSKYGNQQLLRVIKLPEDERDHSSHSMKETYLDKSLNFETLKIDVLTHVRFVPLVGKEGF